MALSAVRNRSLADEVFSQLLREIFTGRYHPGDTLPPERTLVEVLQVNRHVVREALKRLAQMGILSISQGGGTRVLDYTRDGGLDLLPWYGRYQNDPVEILLLWRSVLEMRAAITTDMVRLCALRATQAMRDELVALSRELTDAAEDPKRLWELEVRFWYCMADGSDNRAYRWALNSVLTSGTLDLKQTERFAAFETRMAGFRRKLADAVAAGDVAGAEAEARTTMLQGMQAFYERFFGGDASARHGGVAKPTRRKAKRSSATPIRAVRSGTKKREESKPTKRATKKTAKNASGAATPKAATSPSKRAAKKATKRTAPANKPATRTLAGATEKATKRSKKPD